MFHVPFSVLTGHGRLEVSKKRVSSPSYLEKLSRYNQTHSLDAMFFQLIAAINVNTSNGLGIAIYQAIESQMRCAVLGFEVRRIYDEVVNQRLEVRGHLTPVEHVASNSSLRFDSSHAPL